MERLQGYLKAVDWISEVESPDAVHSGSAGWVSLIHRTVNKAVEWEEVFTIVDPLNIHCVVRIKLSYRFGTISSSHCPHGRWAAIRKQQQHRRHRFQLLTGFR